MNPSLGDAKVDKLLTQFSQMYRNENYIAEMILPPLTVKEKTGKYAKYGTENLRAYADNLYRAPGTRAVSVDYSVSQGEYSCREKSAEKLVPDEFVNNTDRPYDPKRDAVAIIMDNMMVNQELALSTYMANTSNITQNTTLAGTSQWSDYDNSDPIDDIETGIQAIRAATSQRPNIAWMSHSVMTKLKYHPDIREQAKYTGNARLGDDAFLQLLKEFFGLSEIYVGDAVYNSADPGQTASITDVWGKHFWLAYKNPQPTLMKATLGYTFIDVPSRVETYREEEKVSDVVRVRKSYDQNVMDTSLVYLINSAIA